MIERDSQKPKPAKEKAREVCKTISNCDMLEKEDKWPMTCTKCDSFQANVHELTNHMKNHWSDDKCCPICGDMYHLMTHRGQRPFACKSCSQSPIQEGNLINHTPKQASNMKSKGFSPDKGSEINVDKNVLQPQDPKLAISKSRAKFNKTTDYGKEIKEDNWPIACMKCDQALNNLQQFNNHMTAHWDNDKCCPLCGLSSKAFAQNFAFHLKTHTGERPNVCQICSISFTQKGHLAMHIVKIHTGEKPYVCKICISSFNQKDQMAKHILQHRETPGFPNDIDDVDFCDLMAPYPEKKSSGKSKRSSSSASKPKCNVQK